MTELQILIINLLLYIILFFVCIQKYKVFSIVTFLSFLYLTSSISSLLLYTFPLYSFAVSAQGTISLEAVLYQFTINTLFITAFRRASFSKCRIIRCFDTSKLIFIQKMLISLLTVYVLFALPIKAISFFSGNNLSDMRDEIYGINTDDSIPFFAHLILRIFGSMDIFLLVMVMLKFMIKGKVSFIDKYSIFLYFLLKLTTIFGAVSRSTIFFLSVELFITFLFFKDRIPTKLKRKVYRVGAICVIPLVMVFNIISMSRFSNGDKLEYQFATLRYLGETQLNFTALAYNDLKEPFHGYNQFPVFRRILGLSYSDGTDRDDMFNTYILSHYKYPHSTYIFYGLVGDFFMNWGWIITLMVSLFIFWYFTKTFNKGISLTFLQIMLCIYISSIVAKGIFFTDFRNESGNIFILFLIYLSFRLKKRNKILTKIM